MILRLGNVYGPGKSKSGGPGVVFAFARAMLCGERTVIHWYNQRGEHSANRIKELKYDFAGDWLPRGQFSANELYFAQCALSYNLFALLRHLLPVAGSRSRAPTVRWRLIALAGKLVLHGRQWTPSIFTTYSRDWGLDSLQSEIWFGNVTSSVAPAASQARYLEILADAESVYIAAVKYFEHLEKVVRVWPINTLFIVQMQPPRHFA